MIRYCWRKRRRRREISIDLPPPERAVPTTIDASLCEECLWHVEDEHSRRMRRTDSGLLKIPAQLVEPGPESCDLCRLLLRSAVAYWDLGHRLGLLGADWHIPQRRRVHQSHRYPSYESIVAFTRPGAKMPHERGDLGLRDNQSRRNPNELLVELEITTPPTQNLPWNGFANANEISGYSGSEECLAKIQGWLAECLGKHLNCNKGSDMSADVEGPRRLLDTGPLDGHPWPRLIERDVGKMQRYCALSYCWGNEKIGNYLTTRDTYSARRNGIPFRELPRLFQDAVVITRRVGCRYIWVGCICYKGAGLVREC